MEGNELIMELNATQEIIVKLKAVKDKRNLSVPDIKKMVDATGAYLSLTTLRRVFADGSEENDSFNYEATLRPIAQVLLLTDDMTAESGIVKAKLETYEAICRHKDEVINTLNRQIDALRAEHDNRCRECEGRMDFLMSQIKLKDARMERKDKIIDKLLEKVL